MNIDMWKYADHLRGLPLHNRVSLGEGNTPLVRSRAIGPALGLNNLYFKLENLNPTGSYKDRFASPLISLMKANGQAFCMATSSGNTGAALAAYSAAAGIKCIMVIVDGAPLPKIRQMQLYGATTLMVKGFGLNSEVTTAVFQQLRKIAGDYQLPLPVSAFSICPEGMQGVQTILYELADALDPDHVFVPAGGGGLTLAMAKAVDDLVQLNPGRKTIAIHCVQPVGNDTMASAIRNGAEQATAIPAATTSISGLQVPSILDGNEVIRHCRKLGGNGYAVEDQDVYRFHQELAIREGIFSEPAGAVALAGLADAVRRGEVQPNDKIVCLVTGSGFKDMAAVEKNFSLPDILGISPETLTEKIYKEI